MLKLAHFKIPALLAASLLFSACANQNFIPLFQTKAERLAEQSRIIEAEKFARTEKIKAQQQPPLFTYIDPSVDPLMWTNEQNNTVAPGDEATIIGRFPGQRELPFDLYKEAAIPHNIGQHGTVLYLNNDEEENIWDRIRNGYDLPHQANARINTHIRWYSKHQSYLNRVADRADKYLYLIVEEADRMGLPLEIALLPVVESAFQPFAYSHGRAAGIWQFIPATGKIYGLKQNWWYDGRRDIVASTQAAFKFLKGLHRSLNHDWMLALAAYNSGYGTVTRAMKKNKRNGKPTDFWSLDLPKETKSYVPKLLALAEIIHDPGKFNLTLPPIANEPYMAEVGIGSQIDLALAAELADITLEELYILNPGYNRWATDPKGPHKLMVPVENAESFEENLASLPSNKRISWVRHKIKKGQSLLAIADKYDTTVSLIKDLNQVRGTMIREGQNLIIPVSSHKGKTYTLSAEQRLIALQNTKRKGKEKQAYRVKSGDTLWSISRKYKVRYQNLAKWNGLAPRDTLRTGQKLIIWSKEGKLSKAKFSPHPSQLVTQKINYRVRRGDSLALISQKFKINVRDVIRWNNTISKKKYLQPGQRLTLYVDVTQQAGRT
ncbi:MAG: LysM peptidoglycan-binding domain-containing protein [Gammaproteobacteria bacterium]|nr:LysM peptidoglycan-binding domain-containing protein [Gammaproteobacteria bacterium]